jgi:hypothetical protein
MEKLSISFIMEKTMPIGWKIYPARHGKSVCNGYFHYMLEGISVIFP